MVRRGSTVRVRQRALQNACKEAFQRRDPGPGTTSRSSRRTREPSLATRATDTAAPSLRLRATVAILEPLDLLTWQGAGNAAARRRHAASTVAGVATRTEEPPMQEGGSVPPSASLVHAEGPRASSVERCATCRARHRFCALRFGLSTFPDVNRP